MKVLQFDNFAVYVYADHIPPHCHLRFSDGEEIVVSIPILKLLVGNSKKFKKDVKQALLDNIDFLCTKWEELN